MADTAVLTQQHRLAQTRIRSQALRDFMRLWPIWTGDEASFVDLVHASLALVRVYRNISAAAASTYYQAFREAAGITGAATPTLAGALPDVQVATSLYVTGRDGLRKALQAGQSATQARDTALVRSSGTITRHVLGGSRQTVIDSVTADPEALGWARVTDGNPCAFCLMLASRGAVYKSEQTADFQAHDHCECSVMPVYDKHAEIPDLQRWRDIYNAAQNEGEASGLLQAGENSSAARIRAVRQYLTTHA